MATIIAYFEDLSSSELTLHLAGLVLVFLLLVLILPFGDNRRVDNSWYRQLQQKKKTQTEQEQKEKAARAATRKKAKNQPKTGLSAWLHQRAEANKKQKESVNSKLDFLLDQAPVVRHFKHPKANSTYKELVRDGSLLDPKIPDFDEIDQIFTAMLKAGAVKGKEYLVTNFEHHYLEKLRLWFSKDYYIYCQVAVGSALTINADVSKLNLVQRRTFAQKCHNMSFDFMLVEKGTDRIICAIELDDPTHNRVERKLRDRRLDRVCAAAGIPIFHITNIYQKPDIERLRKRRR